MNLSLTNKASFFILFLVNILLIPIAASSATEEATDWLDEPINLSFQNEPLSNVLKQISQQTGISIAYDQRLANEKISGNYNNVKTSDAITRLFKSKNKSIQVNKDKKIIIVKTFGAKSFIWANGTLLDPNNSSQMALGELEKMHAQQYKEYKERIANNNEILMDGLTRGELDTMHENQNQDYQARIANKNEVLKGGITRGELQSMHERQYAKYKINITNDNEKLDGGITRGELNILHEQQYKKYQKRITNDAEVLEGGIPRSELDKMHEKQQTK